ncbi:hypothetical protein PENTCL1PPCAC_26335, partial [Pristionchus entomophagus]
GLSQPPLVSDRIIIEIEEEGGPHNQSTARLVDPPPISPSTLYQSLSSSTSIVNSLVPTHSSCTNTTHNIRDRPSPSSHHLEWKGMAGGCAGDGSLCSVCLGVFITLSVIAYLYIDVQINKAAT